MKIRVMGTREECELAQQIYEAIGKREDVLSGSVSGLYPNRGSTNQYRVYIEVVFKPKGVDISPMLNGH